MATIKSSEEVDHDRRRFVGVVATSIAAAGTTGWFSANMPVAAQGDAVRPFRVNITEDELAECRRRIAATRWPDRETVNDQTQGAQLVKLQELVRYWGTDYDWRKAEAKLN